MGRCIRENIAASGTIKNTICCYFGIATIDSICKESSKIGHKCTIVIFCAITNFLEYPPRSPQEKCMMIE